MLHNYVYISNWLFVSLVRYCGPNSFFTFTIFVASCHSLIICTYVVPAPDITISPPDTLQGAMVGNPQVINCTVSTVSGVEPSLVMISWMRPGGGSVMNDSRVIISPTTSSGNTYNSSLQFTYLMEEDEGMYTCNVLILETSGAASVNLDILPGQ